MGEVYVGVKFETVFERREPPQDARLPELLAWCRRWAAAGWIAKAMGNLSMRTGQGFIITPTGTDPGTMTEADFVEVLSADDRQTRVAGLREPSSESRIHAGIYACRPEVQAVFHGHSQAILEAANRLGLPVTVREQPYGTPALVEEVVRIVPGQSFVVMRNHGWIALGRSLDDAGQQLESVLQKMRNP